MESGFLSFGIQNSTQGIRNPASDWNPESKFHWQGIRNPETTAWSPVSTTSPDYLTWGKFGQILKLVSTGHGKNSTNLHKHEQTLWQINLEVNIICIDEYILWLSKIIYYSLKIFPRFWLAKSSRMIHYNQLLMTKFGRILCLTRKWHEQCNLLQINEPLTEKTWGRGWVVWVVKTKMADTSLVSRVRTTAGTRRSYS